MPYYCAWSFRNSGKGIGRWACGCFLFGEPAPDREKPFGCWFRILCHQQSCAVITLSLHCRSQLRQGVGEEQFQSKQSQTDFKGGGIRRSSDDRSTLSKKPWKVFAGTRKEPKSNRTLFQLQHEAGNRTFRKDHCQTSASEPWSELHLSTPTWINLNRCSDSAPEFGGGAETRPVGDNKKCSSLLQRRPNQPSVQRSSGRNKELSFGSREVDGKDFKSWNRVPKHEQQPIAIEISSGSGHLSRALRRHCRQLTVFEVDLKHEPAFDLTHRKNQRQLIQFILRNRVDFIWLGTPCNSWSRARRNDRRGPGPLRDVMKTISYVCLNYLLVIIIRFALAIVWCDSVQKFFGCVYNLVFQWLWKTLTLLVFGWLLLSSIYFLIDMSFMISLIFAKRELHGAKEHESCLPTSTWGHVFINAVDRVASVHELKLHTWPWKGWILDGAVHDPRCSALPHEAAQSSC